MYKRIARNCWVVLFLHLFSQTRAQVVLTPQLPPTGLTQKTQLWNLMVMNASPNAIEVQLELSLLDLQTNQKILTCTSRQLTLSKGAKILDWNTVQPVTYNSTGIVAAATTPMGWLSPGNYRVCYQAVRINNDSREALTEECTETEIAPLSPPQLALPADKSVLDEKYPQFSWLPPAPLSIFQRLTYELKVVELLPNQSYGEALQNNLPFFVKDNLVQVHYPYPAGNRAFERGKDYVWQVTAKDLNRYSVKTDAWLFTTKTDAAPTKRSVGYVRLQQELVPQQFVSDGFVKFVYLNAVGDSAVNYVVYREKESDGRKLLDGRLKLRPGENFIDLSLGDVRSLRPEDSYVFELLNTAGERWKLAFVYQEPASEKNDR